MHYFSHILYMPGEIIPFYLAQIHSYSHLLIPRLFTVYIGCSGEVLCQYYTVKKPPPHREKANMKIRAFRGGGTFFSRRKTTLQIAHKKKKKIGTHTSFIKFESNYFPLLWPSYSQHTHSTHTDADNISQRWWCIQILTTCALNKCRARYRHSLM